MPNIDRAGMGKAEVVYIDTEDRCPIYKLTAALRGGTNTGWTIQMAMAYPSYLAFEWAAWKRFHRDLRMGASMSFTALPRCRQRCPVQWPNGAQFHS